MATKPDVRTAPKKQGRRPGTNESRHAILAAAQARFAKEGYAGATIRKIAADAGVDASLVMQFFGSKDELFGAVMSDTLRALSRFSEAFVGPEHSLGERVTRSFLQAWDGDPKDSEPLLAMLRSAVSNEQASSQLREFIQARLTDAIAPQQPIVQVPALVDQDTESLVRYIAPAVQSILNSRIDT
jgi:AcrR family transcriptional regulator